LAEGSTVDAGAVSKIAADRPCREGGALCLQGTVEESQDGRTGAVSKKRFSSWGDRGFESGFLQRRVGCSAEPPKVQSDPLYLRRVLGSCGALMVVTNRGTTPAWRSVSITGIPSADLPAEARGYNVTRNLYRPDGKDPDLRVRQTDPNYR